MTSWTEKRTEIVTSLWMKGFSATQIAERLGNITRNAVIGKVHRLGLKRKPNPVKEKARRMRRSAHTPARVSVPLKYVKKPDIVEIAEHGECRGIMGKAEGLNLKLCRKKIPDNDNYCEKHQKLYYSPQQYRRKQNEQARPTTTSQKRSLRQR